MAEAEVAEHRAPVELEEDVAGRDVAVDDPEVVEPAEGGGERREGRDDLARGQVSAGAHEGVERAAAQVRHDDRGPPVGERQARQDRDDVRRRGGG